MRQLFTALFICLLLSSAVAQSIVYVTPTGSGNQSGGSWSDALSGTQLQSRLASASAGTQFWIKGGSYSPGVLRTATFQIPSGVQVYGGFAGNESQLIQRQLSSPSSTTFTGETGDPNITGDNNSIVVTFNQVSADTRLDGVIITRSTDKGVQNRLSGSQDKTSSPTIANCRIENNEGGGLDNTATNGPKCIMTLINCQFINNQSSFGGAISNRSGSVGQASLTVINCRFENNKATSSDGGAIYNDSYEFGSSAISLQSCQFIGNQSAANGGAIRTSSSSGGGSITMTACLFRKNVASGNGGAVYANADRYSTASIQLTSCLLLANRATNGAATYNYGNMGTSDVTMTNSTLVDNVATTTGGALFCQSEGAISGTNRTTNVIPTVKNSIVRNNTAQNQPFLYYAGSTSAANVTYSDIQGGFTGTGNIDADPQFVDAANGNFRLKSESLAINAGDPASTTATVSATDLDGIARLSEGRIDMGAYETPATIIRYVTVAGDGDQSGSSWSNAIPGMQFPARLKAASAGTQFWVARGTYRPTATTDRAASFSINAGVSLYGGFIGTETTLDQRRANQNETTLSGDIGVQHDKGDNSQVVVYCENPLLGIRLDGFTIRDSYQDGFNSRDGGGGLQVQVSTGINSIHVSNCRFINHVSTSTFSGGGGIVVFTKSNARCTNVIQNCYFSDNLTGYGGAFLPYTDGGGMQRSLVEDCVFERNAAYLYGGAISNHYSSDLNSLTIQRCQFRDNHSVTGYGMSGAAVETTLGSYAILNCLFANNITTGGNGGALYIAGSKPTFTNCVFTGNSAQNGGVVHSVSERATVLADFTNCHFIGNDASGSGGVFSLSSSEEYKGRPTHPNDMRLINCIIRNNSAGSNTLFSVDQYMGSNLGSLKITYSNIQGGFSGTGNIDADPQFVDAPNGNFRLKAGSPSINTGDPNSTTATVSANDLDGNQRVAENRIDMGAYEFQVSALTGSDLSLRLNADSRAPGVGQTVTYWLTVTNDGPSTATGVVWQHRLPDNMHYVGGTTLSVENGIVTGNLGTLPTGESVTAMYQLRATQPGLYINAAQITAADQPDPDSQPNSGTGDGQDDAAQVDIRVGGVSSPVYASANPNQVPLPPVQSNQPAPDPTKVDLALSLSVDSRTPKVGDLLTYVLTITNQGGTTASDIRVTAYLSDGQQFDSSADGMSVSDGGISGGIASIPAGGQASLRFTARLTSAKMGVTKAQIRQASPADVDSTPDNGTDNGEDDTAQVDLRAQTGL